MESSNDVGRVYLNWGVFKKQLAAYFLSKKIDILEQEIKKRNTQDVLSKQEKQLQLVDAGIDKVIIIYNMLESNKLRNDQIKPSKDFMERILDKTWEEFLIYNNM
tara:strand:+ start:87 stop:401 length:315 start_codon:yes stop_codon:yes gene_type:complete